MLVFPIRPVNKPFKEYLQQAYLLGTNNEREQSQNQRKLTNKKVKSHTAIPQVIISQGVSVFFTILSNQSICSRTYISISLNLVNILDFIYKKEKGPRSQITLCLNYFRLLI